MALVRLSSTVGRADFIPNAMLLVPFDNQREFITISTNCTLLA